MSLSTIPTHPHLRPAGELSESLATDGSDGAGVAVVCHPIAGKHLAFDGRLLHGAPAELARPAPTGAEMAACEEVRVTILVNLWPYKPLGLRRLPDEVACELSSGDHFCLQADASPTPIPIADADSSPRRFEIGDGGTHPALLAEPAPGGGAEALGDTVAWRVRLQSE